MKAVVEYLNHQCRNKRSSRENVWELQHNSIHQNYMVFLQPFWKYSHSRLWEIWCHIMWWLMILAVYACMFGKNSLGKTIFSIFCSNPPKLLWEREDGDRKIWLWTWKFSITSMLPSGWCIEIGQTMYQATALGWLDLWTVGATYMKATSVICVVTSCYERYFGSGRLNLHELCSTCFWRYNGLLFQNCVYIQWHICLAIHVTSKFSTSRLV